MKVFTMSQPPTLNDLEDDEHNSIRCCKHCDDNIMNNRVKPFNLKSLIHKHRVKEYRQKLHEEFASNITLHGYRQLVTEKGWRKVTWIFVMSVLTFFAVYLFYNMLVDFGYKTVLEYEMDESGMYLNFPTLTICSNSPVFTKKAYNNFPVNISLEEYKDFYLNELSSLSYNMTSNKTMADYIYKKLALLNITTYEQILSLFENDIEDSSEIWNQFGPTCFFGKQPCNLKRDVREILHWKFSVCHQFNYFDIHNKSKIQTSNDETLMMLINIHADYKLVSYYPFYGLVLFIHPYGTPHHLTEYTESLGLQNGMFTTINIELTEVNLLPSPYSTGCGTKELKIIKNFPYSRALCEVDCILDKVYRKCKCVGFEFKNQVGDDVRICSAQEMKCYFEYLAKFKTSCISYASTCPRECRYYKYRFQRSLIMSIGDEIMHDSLSKTEGWNKSYEQTDEYIRKNLLGFEIGYKSLSRVRENYKPSVTFSEVIGVVGGSIGLCLGFSFVTGYEVIFFLFDYITAPWKVKPFYNLPNGNA